MMHAILAQLSPSARTAGQLRYASNIAETECNYSTVEKQATLIAEAARK